CFRSHSSSLSFGGLRAATSSRLGRVSPSPQPATRLVTPASAKAAPAIDVPEERKKRGRRKAFIVVSFCVVSDSLKMQPLPKSNRRSELHSTAPDQARLTQRRCSRPHRVAVECRRADGRPFRMTSLWDKPRRRRYTKACTRCARW